MQTNTQHPPRVLQEMLFYKKYVYILFTTWQRQTGQNLLFEKAQENSIHNNFQLKYLPICWKSFLK